MKETTRSGKQASVGQRLQAERERLRMRPKELAEAAGIPIDSYRKYEGNAAVPGGGALAGLVRAGVRVEWVLTGAEPMLAEPELPKFSRASEPPAGYQAVNLELMSLVVSAVERLLPSSGPEERAGLIALAYDYMTARATSDPNVLSKFIRQVAAWARSAAPQPALGSRIADDVPSEDLTRTYRDGEAPAAPDVKKREGEK